MTSTIPNIARDPTTEFGSLNIGAPIAELPNLTRALNSPATLSAEYSTLNEAIFTFKIDNLLTVTYKNTSLNKVSDVVVTKLKPDIILGAFLVPDQQGQIRIIWTYEDGTAREVIIFNTGVVMGMSNYIVALYVPRISCTSTINPSNFDDVKLQGSLCAEQYTFSRFNYIPNCIPIADSFGFTNEFQFNDGKVLYISCTTNQTVSVDVAQGEIFENIIGSLNGSNGQILYRKRNSLNFVQILNAPVQIISAEELIFPVTFNILTIEKGAPILSEEDSPPCGPKLTVIANDSTMTIYVTDKGYSYNLVDTNLLVSTPQPTCDEVTSVFSLPLLNLENKDVATYVLSGFVFGKFSTKWIQSEYFNTFLDRLLLTPFRGFVNIYTK